MRDLNNEGPDELQAESKMIATTNLKLTRREMMTGAASAGLLLATPASKALAQARVTVTEGNFQPIPIAIRISFRARRVTAKSRPALRRSLPTT